MEEWSEKALQNFVDIWIVPEIHRRQKAGEIPEPFGITMAQVIFYPDGKPAEVRLNSEVNFKVITTDGEPASININTMDHNFLRFELNEQNLANCGHFTMVGFGDNRWSWSFDLIYSKDKTRRHLNAAREFICGAEYAVNNNLWRLFSECVFSAKELISRAYLLSEPDQKYQKKGNHNVTHSRINMESKLGNIPKEYIAIFNKFRSLRQDARYVEGDVTFSYEEAMSYVEHAKEYLRLVEFRIRQ